MKYAFAGTAMELKVFLNTVSSAVIILTAVFFPVQYKGYKSTRRCGVMTGIGSPVFSVNHPRVHRFLLVAASGNSASR